MASRKPRPPEHRPTACELYTPENVATALAMRGPWPAVPRAQLPALRLVKRLHDERADMFTRIAHGLTLSPDNRRLARLLVWPVRTLRALVGVEEASAFVVSHVVLPIAQALSPTDRLTFLEEMHALPFAESGETLGNLSTKPNSPINPHFYP